MATKVRYSRDDLEQILLNAGLQLLDEQGIGAAEHITFGRVFERVAQNGGPLITQGQIHKRIWEHQGEFQVALLAKAAHRYPESISQLHARADEILDSLDLSQMSNRVTAMSTICQTLGREQIAMQATSRHWQLFIGIWAAVLSSPTIEDDRVVAPIALAAHQAATKQVVDLYAHIVMRLGYRLMLNRTMSEFATVVLALADGLALRMESETDVVASPTVRLFADTLDLLVGSYFTVD
jgi:hypothetical protein